MSNHAPRKRTDLDFTVNVINQEEEGTISLSALQPEVGTPIIAWLNDPDADPENNDLGESGIEFAPNDSVDAPFRATGWTWYTSKVTNPDLHTDSHWSAVPTDDRGTFIGGFPEDQGGPTIASFFVPRGERIVSTDPNNDAIDETRFLRIRVDYTDPQSDTTTKTAYGMSKYAVRAEVSTTGDEGLTTFDNGSPDFQQDTATRTVAEDVAVGTAVGAAFRAVEPDPEDVAKVTYSLQANEDPNDDTADEFFYIENVLDSNGRNTGQIRVKRGLDHEATGLTNVTDGEYVVTVVVTDPSGESDSIVVTITADDVNETPTVNGVVGLRVQEGTTAANGDLVYEQLTATPAWNNHEYTVTELDDRDTILSWRLEGDDWRLFDLSGPSGFEPRRINFKRDEQPDFENPTDSNEDNVYEVTVVAIDKANNRGTKDVTIVVYNVQEDGELVFSAGGDAEPDTKIVAEVQDPDDHGGTLGGPYQGVLVMDWQWSRSETDTGTFAVDPGCHNK